MSHTRRPFPNCIFEVKPIYLFRRLFTYLSSVNTDDHVYWRSDDLILGTLSSALVEAVCHRRFGASLCLHLLVTTPDRPYLTLQVKAPFLFTTRHIVTSLTARIFSSAGVRFSHVVTWKEAGLAGCYMFPSVRTPFQGQSIPRSQSVEFVSFKVPKFSICIFRYPHLPSTARQSRNKTLLTFQSSTPARSQSCAP